jgi:transcriptional regulator with XRE-family HTH domain
VDHRRDVQDFLVSRRARVSPEQAGLPSYGGKRRVPGLRREEVALLAGLSVDYYARLERGNLSGASESVLEAVARALQLDDAERQHLLDLARHASTAAPRAARRKPAAAPRAAVGSILDGMTSIPAYVRTSRMEIVAANELCRALYGGVLDEDRLPLNLARYVFLDPHSRGFFLDWDHVADDLAGGLRIQAGRDPRDKELSDLIGELSTRSDEFVARWGRQDVRLHRTARKRLNNRVVGDIELTGNALELPGGRPDSDRLHRRRRLPGRGPAEAARHLDRYRSQGNRPRTQPRLTDPLFPYRPRRSPRETSAPCLTCPP